MVFKATDLEGARLAAIDGPIGEVEELFFDDQHWRRLVDPVGAGVDQIRAHRRP
jgi:hypothetical protein